MELKSGVNKAVDFIKRFRYAAIVLVVGLLLMVIPTGKHTAVPQLEKNPEPVKNLEASWEEELSLVLSRLEGAGKVEVILSLRRGSQTIYQTDSSSSGNGPVSIDTVIISDGDRNQQGLISRVDPPEYLGAIVLCQGADRADVRLAITEAISKITGLGADKISVLKMK